MPARAKLTTAPDYAARHKLFKERFGNKRCLALAEVWPWWREKSAQAAPVITDANLQLARDHHQRSLCSDEQGRRRPLWSTKTATLAEYGLGIELHFRFLSIAICSFLVATLLMVPQLLLNINGQGLEDRSGTSSVITMLAQTTIANLGMPSDGHEVLGQRLEAHTVTFLLAILDVLATLVLAVGALWFKLVSIPRALERQRRASIGPEAFTLEVHDLPQRLQSSRHAQYSRLLESHFEGLLDARVTEHTAVYGSLVVHADDKGSVTWSHGRSRCCRPPSGLGDSSFRSAAVACGRDGRGRRLGRIEGIFGGICRVEWLPMRGEADQTLQVGKVACYSVRNHERKISKDASVDQPAVTTGAIRFAVDPDDDETISGALSDLLDAELLERLELAGCDPAQRHIGELPVHSVQLVHDLWGYLRKRRQFQRRPPVVVEESDPSLRGPKAGFNGRPIFKSPSDRVPFIGNVASQNVLGAFVTFSRIRDRDFVHREFQHNRLYYHRCFRQSWRLKFEGSKIWVDDAPAPADIDWENRDHTRSRCSFWFCFLLVICTVMVLCSCAVVAAAQDAASSSEASRLAVTAAIVVSLVNLLVVSPASFLVELARPKSRRLRDDWVFMAVFWVQVLNICLVAPLVYFDFSGSEDVLGLVGKGSFSDLVHEWYDSVGGLLLLLLVVHSLHPLCGVVRVLTAHCWNWLHTSSAQSMQQLLEIYTPPHFDLAGREAQLASALFSALVYSAAMPLLMPLLLLGTSLAYICDKYVLLRFSYAPHACCQLPTSTRRMVWALLCGLWLHSAFAAWAYSQPAVVASRGHPRKGADRVLVESALPHLIAAVGLTGAILALLFDLLPGGRRKVGASAESASFAGQASPPKTGPADLTQASSTPLSYSMYDLPELQDHVQGNTHSPSSSKGKEIALKAAEVGDGPAKACDDNGAKQNAEADMEAEVESDQSVPLEGRYSASPEPSVLGDECPLEGAFDTGHQWSKEDEMELDHLDRERGLEDTSDNEICRRPVVPMTLCSDNLALLCCTVGACSRPPARPITSEMIGVTPTERSRPSEPRSWLCSTCTPTMREEVWYTGGSQGQMESSRSLDITAPAAVRVAGRDSPSKCEMIGVHHDTVHAV